MAADDRRLGLRLFIAGSSADGAIAVANLKALFAGVREHGVEIEIVDVEVDPAQAVLDRIMVTPTLVKYFPLPYCRILGNLKNSESLLQLLGFGGPALEVL